jgi:glycosyltransferase involved in cell wall biosynthesis
MNIVKKKTLFYIITKSELGGAQGNVYDLISQFYKDYQVHLATGSHGPLTEDVSLLGVPVHIIPNLTRNLQFFNDLIAVKECVSLIKTIKPQIIHAHSSKAGVIARIAGKICHVPTVFTAHGWGFSPNTPKIRQKLALIAEKSLAPLANRVICVSANDSQLALRSGVGNQNSLAVVRYGIKNIPLTLANPSHQPPRLIMVARFNEQKDQTTLLQAIAKLHNHSIHLDLVGSGPYLESSKALANSLGIAEQVSFLGDRRDVPDLLARSQIFILSTHYEGLPISILEAMRAGLPVVATSVNGIPEEVEHGKTGLTVPHQDVEALANALSILINSPDKRYQMGKAGRHKFEQEFTVERMVNNTNSIYNEIIKNTVAFNQMIEMQ